MINTLNWLPIDDIERYEVVLNDLTKDCFSGELTDLYYGFAIAQTSLGPVDIFKFRARARDSEGWSYQIGQQLFDRCQNEVRVNIACATSGYKYDFPCRTPVQFSEVKVVHDLEVLLSALAANAIVFKDTTFVYFVEQANGADR